MRLYELDRNDLQTGYYDPADDKMNVRQPTDTRKSKLCLRDINRLKRMRAMQRLANLKRQDLLGIMYSTPEEPAGGGGGMGF